MLNKQNRPVSPWMIQAPSDIAFQYLEDQIIWTAIHKPDWRKLLLDGIPELGCSQIHWAAWRFIRANEKWAVEQFRANLEGQSPLAEWAHIAKKKEVIEVYDPETTCEKHRELLCAHRIGQVCLWGEQQLTACYAGEGTIMGLAGALRHYLDDIMATMGLSSWKDNMKGMVDRVLSQNSIQYLPTPWDNVNRLILGLPSPALTVIGAPTGVGKTAFLTEIAWYCIQKSIPCLFISVEMGEQGLIPRLVSRATGMLTQTDIQLASMGIERWEPGSPEDHAYKIAQKAIAEAENEEGWWLVDSKYRINELGNLIRCAEEAITKYGVKVVLVDYIQIIQVPELWNIREGRERVRRVVEGLKSLAIQKGVAVVAAAQFSRQAYGRKPGLEDFRDSSAIECVADLLIGIQGEVIGGQVSRENMFFYVLKNRYQSWTGRIAMHFNSNIGSFSPREEKQDDIPF